MSSLVSSLRVGVMKRMLRLEVRLYNLPVGSSNHETDHFVFFNRLLGTAPQT